LKWKETLENLNGLFIMERRNEVNNASFLSKSYALTYKNKVC
jgi:hypothetical protein